MVGDDVVFDVGIGQIRFTSGGSAVFIVNVGMLRGKVDNRKVSWLTCWRQERFCGLKLRRPHLTCLYCFLRRVANGELPAVFSVKFIVVPVLPAIKPWKRVIIKKVVSLLEFLGR